ncbi:MAG: hypothetical protein WC661_14585 [Opitutaceae bacterium]|jgi:hypothetical protein
MKTDLSSRWTDLVQRARRDTPGPLDTAALLRTLPDVAAARLAFAFLEDFAALFATPRALAACAASIAVFATAGVWQLNSEWQELEPLVSLLPAMIGGAV